MNKIRHNKVGFDKHMPYDKFLQHKACKSKAGMYHLDGVSRLRKANEPVCTETNWIEAVPDFGAV